MFLSIFSPSIERRKKIDLDGRVDVLNVESEQQLI